MMAGSDSHSRIHCGPEVKFFKDFYGDFINDELRHVRLFSTLTSLGLNYDELLLIFGDAFIEAHTMAAKKARKPRWADKNPENVLYLPQWNKLLPVGFLFIHVVRHPLDVLASLKEFSFPKAVPADFEEKVRLYLDFHAKADAYINAWPESSIRVKYEDLVTKPEKVVKGIFSFLGEDYEPDVISEYFSAQRGNGIEDPKIATTRSIHDMSIGRWRKDLSHEEVKITKEVLGNHDDFMLNLGYLF